MFFELERQQRILDDLKALIYSDKLAITQYEIKDGKELELGEWRSFSTNEVWLGNDKHRWFQTKLIIPAAFDGKKVEYRISTGREGEWDATNPQALLYINGKVAQGIDVNHTCVSISSCAKAGESYDIRFLMYSGTKKEELILKTELLVLDTPTEKLYYDLLIPVDSAKVLSQGNDFARKILLKASKAVDTIDLRKPYSDFYYQSVEKASALLKEEFYTKIDENAPVVSAIGHTHIDIAWLWTVSETREKVLRSFATVLRLMEEYPDYKFMSSQPILYQFVKEQEPEMYEKIKERIREGRWEVDGAMWLESDCNLPSGESLVRQIIKGEKFFADEFGIKSKSLWLPDVFGYSAALPQILKKCGIEYFMTTKICWNQFNMLPNDTFMWKGLDGTEIFTYMPTTTDYNRNLGLNISFTDKKNTTTYTGNINANMTLGTYNRFQNKDLQENTLMLYGFGDGGGGPTKEMLEQSKRLQYGIPGIPRIVKERESDFFDRTYANLKNNPDMPKWSGELYFEYHRGTYTSMAKNKWYNRKNELLYRDLECLSSTLLSKGYDYPVKTIERGWDILLLNQFHDIIPGTSIEAVYQVTDVEYEQILSDAKTEIDQKMDQLINTIAYRENTFVVYNSLGYIRDDIVTLTVQAEKQVCCVKDFNGTTYPVQYIDDTTIIFFAKSIPSMGYKLFEVVYGQAPKTSENQLSNTYENEFYTVCFDDIYQITSLIEKQTGKEFIAKGKKGNQLLAFEDRPINWDNWDIDIFHKRKQYQMDHVKAPELIEDGAVRTCIKVTHCFIDSTITQYIYLYKDLPRIDFYNKVDWQQHNVLLKVGFPVEVNTNKATYEIQFGNVERETTANHSWDVAKFETCAHKWADVSENGLGISLLNDCKYGYDIKEGQMNLTLIKSGIDPNPNADIGEHEFTYSIYAHKGGVMDSGTIEMAYNLNTNLYTKFCSNGSVGSAQTEQSFLSVDKDNCFIEAIKQAEDGNGIILRVYENKNKREQATFTFSNSIDCIYECDLLENNLEKMDTTKHQMQILIKPYEIKTYRILFA